MDIALRALLPLSGSAVGVLLAPRSALAQISSLRHGLLTPSLGFRQLLTRPSRGIRGCNQSLATIPFGFTGKTGDRSCDSTVSAVDLRCRVGMCCCPFSTASSQARGHQVHGRLDVGARNSPGRGWVVLTTTWFCMERSMV